MQQEGLPHYSSCMVCMVKDNKSKCFIPSCSALVQPGMDIDASGDDVVLIRKKQLSFFFRNTGRNAKLNAELLSGWL